MDCGSADGIAFGAGREVYAYRFEGRLGVKTDEGDKGRDIELTLKYLEGRVPVIRRIERVSQQQDISWPPWAVELERDRYGLVATLALAGLPVQVMSVRHYRADFAARFGSRKMNKREQSASHASARVSASFLLSVQLFHLLQRHMLSDQPLV